MPRKQDPRSWPRPIKDWRRGSYAKSLSLRRWPWEFLRRNEEYQEEWAGLIEAFERERVMGRDVALLTAAGEDDPEKPDFAIIGGVENRFRRWGLTGGYVNPLQDKPRLFGLRTWKPWVSTVHYGTVPQDPLPREVAAVPTAKDAKLGVPDASDLLLRGREARVRLNPGEVAAAFDLRFPLDPQFRGLKSLLRQLQSEHQQLDGLPSHRATRHIDQWPLYLRLLDARAAGADEYEIAEHLGWINEADPDFKADEPARKRVKRKMRDALRLTEPEGYLYIKIRR